MSRWFRMYADVVDNPKVQLLAGDDFKAWVNLLCLAASNGGRLPSRDAIAFKLRMTVTGVDTVLERLVNAGLIDKVSGGADGWGYAPHDWKERQFNSDSSTPRVQRYRERKRSAGATPSDTDTEKEARAHAREGDFRVEGEDEQLERLRRLVADRGGVGLYRAWLEACQLRFADGWLAVRVPATRSRQMTEQYLSGVLPVAARSVFGDAVQVAYQDGKGGA